MAVILAVQRQDRDRGSVATDLQPGDVLLVDGDWTSLQELADDRDLLVFDSPEQVRRQAVD